MNLHWHSPGDFLAMGGHGLYVWGSLAVFAACLAAEGWSLARRRRAALGRIRATRQADAEPRR